MPLSPGLAQIDAEFEVQDMQRKSNEKAAAQRVEECMNILTTSRYRYFSDGVSLYPTSDPNILIRVQIQDAYMGKPRDCVSATFKVGQENTYRKNDIVYTTLYKYVASENCDINTFKTCQDLDYYEKRRWDDGDQTLKKYIFGTQVNLSGDARWSRVEER